jgi:hypothetical protein
MRQPAVHLYGSILSTVSWSPARSFAASTLRVLTRLHQFYPARNAKDNYDNRWPASVKVMCQNFPEVQFLDVHPMVRHHASHRPRSGVRPVHGKLSCSFLPPQPQKQLVTHIYNVCSTSASCTFATPNAGQEHTMRSHTRALAFHKVTTRGHLRGANQRLAGGSALVYRVIEHPKEDQLAFKKRQLLVTFC